MAEGKWVFGAWEPSGEGRGHRGKGGRRGGRKDRYHWTRDDSEESQTRFRGRSMRSEEPIRPQDHFRGRGMHSEEPIRPQDRFRGRGRGPRGHRRGGPPEGLRGKEIGLWYAAKSKKKTHENEIMQRQFVHMDMRKERHLTDLLTTIRTTESVEAQPTRSYRDPFDDGEAAFDTDLAGHQLSQDCKDGVHTETSSDVFIPLKTEASNDGYIPLKADISDDGYIPVKTETSDEGYIPVKAEVCGEMSTDDPSTSRQYTSEVKSEIKMETKSNIDINDTGSDNDKEDVTKTVSSLPKSETFSDAEDDADDDDDGTNPVASSVSELYRYAIQMIDDSDNPFMAEFLMHRHTRNRSYENLSDMSAYVGLERDPRLDRQLLAEATERQENNAQFHKMLQFRKKLPSYQMKEQLITHINANQIIVISGETGCGKTTQVAQFILEDYVARGDGSLCRIVCTQPRRISAIAVAERVAEERGELCGRSVGYQIRLESQQPRKQGSILYCTTGIMLKWLQSDPWLSRTSHVILDEIHERDLQSDFLMIILKELTAGRPDLKLILMSATLNANMFSQYFRDCPMMNIPGYTFPVEEFLMEDVVEMIGYQPPEDRQFKRRHHVKRELREKQQQYEQWIDSQRGRYSPATLSVLRSVTDDKVDIDLAAAVVQYIVRHKPDGAILVFLPGAGDIKHLNDMLCNDVALHRGRVLIIPLHSRMPTLNQREVFSKPPPGVRKIVIATNIAETSITIDDVVYVVDGGKIKMKNFDPANNIATLKPEWVSRANAKQRRGRAGRVQPGVCYHLYTEYHSQQFSDYQLPEILRTRLEELCLQIKMLKLGQIETFVGKAMQPPSMEALHHAISTLIHLNALDHKEELTPLGYHLAKMPCDPHTSKMLLFGAMFSCLNPILTVGASLSFKDAFYIPMGKERLADQMRQELAGESRSDHLMLVNAYEGWERAKDRGTAGQYCWEHFLSSSTLRMLSDMRRQFAQLLHEMGFLKSDNPKAADANRNSGNKQLVKAIICAGLYPNVANIYKVKKNVRGDSLLSTKTERRILFHPQSVNYNVLQFDSLWLVYHLKMKTSKIFLYDTTMVSPYPLLFFGGDITVRKDEGIDCIIVDEWIKFRANRRIARLVKELRIELDRLLAYKVTHPGASCWQPHDKEGVLLQAIIDLITTEDTSMCFPECNLLKMEEFDVDTYANLDDFYGCERS